ncbi:hypothetical protein HYDPIDRAFT_177805 [Hydnomerulius pinastri MD-312]|uniref:DNA damage-binding protein 1 n=1 Tax=Hydnomerulius pinastri MD-312 TaxID=994086 RepID=A0A0C9W8Q3_9AGAM|nr:hypothetical protein HYDPIDRAFT_177805 [Hydnomerulius pinastri MD-312]
MKVIATFHPTSSVQDSVKCTLANEAGSEFLVVAKLNRVDFYAIQPEGLRHEQGIEIWGRIRTIKVVPIEHTSRLDVLVLTDHPEPELVFLSFTAHGSGDTALKATKYLSLFERSARVSEFCHDVLVDPSGAIAVVSIYAGRLKVVVLDEEEGGYDRDFDVSISEINLLSLAFVSAEAESYTLAILHYDFQQRLQLLARDLSIEDFQLSPAHSPLLPPILLPGKWFSVEEQTPRLVFVPAVDDTFDGGILVLGGQEIMLYDLASRDVLEKNVRKSRRTEKGKKSRDAEEVTKAKQKEKEREWRKKKARAVITWPWSEVVALVFGNVLLKYHPERANLWCESNKFLIGDKFGRLAMLSVNVSSGVALTLIALGEASSPTTLTYLTNQIVYLGSHFGDSQLLQISSSPVSNLDAPTLPVPSSVLTVKPADPSLVPRRRADENAEGTIVNCVGSYILEVESFKNLAPIVDAVLVDTDNSGQNEIVTCSGGRNTGSLKVVRSGADFQESAFAQGISNVNRIWPLRQMYKDREHTHIIVSTLQETHVLRFEDDQGRVFSSVGEYQKGFITSSRTLAISNILRRTREHDRAPSVYTDSSLVVQVVPNGLLLLNYDSATRQYTRIGDLWTIDKFSDGNPGWVGRNIVAADINASQVVIALDYGRLVVLILEGDRFVRQRYRDFVEDPPRSCTAEISSVTCTPPDSTKNFALHVAVSFWTSNLVKIVSLTGPATESLKEICRTPELPATPRSLLLHNFASNDERKDDRRVKKSRIHLLAGLIDGSVASFLFENETLTDQKIISIGTLPVSMHTCRIKDRPTVFACGSRTSIMFWDKERLQHSPLMLKDINVAAELHTKAYPGSVILASPDSLIIGAVTNFEKLHIRSIPLGYDSARRIVHNPSWRAFAVACVRITPAQIGYAEVFSSSVQLFNDTSFEKLSQLDVEDGEEVTALHSFTTTVSGVPTSFVCAGVATFDEGEKEPSQGRLILLQTDTLQMRLTVATSISIRGCVYALTSVNGNIIAAINSSVVVYNVEGSEKNVSMTQATIWNHNYLITTLVSRGNQLLVGDPLTSISLLKLTGSQLESVAKDYGSLWPTCAEMLDDKSIIGGNSDYNLFLFRLQQNELRKSLEREGHFYLGDIVNKFLPGTLASHEVSIDGPIQPKQLFFTSTGQIGVVIDMNDEWSLHLTALQRNLSTFLERKDGISHSRFRAPKNINGRSDSEASSVGFLDGDFLEQFLHYLGDEKSLSEIMEGQSEPEKLKVSADEVQKALEELQNMH